MIGHLPTLTGEGSGYHSDYIAGLRAKRDARLGKGFWEASKDETIRFWELEVSPCARRREEMSCSGDSLFKERDASWRDTEKEIIRHEVMSHALELSKSYEVSREGRYQLYRAAMERELNSSHFKYDKSRSRPSWPVFSKELSRDWLLSWSLADADTFSMFADQGRLDLRLHIRNRSFRRAVLASDQEDRFLKIPYPYLVEGFCSAYTKFQGMEDLELCIKAYAELYKMVENNIDQAIQQSGLLDRSA